MEPKYWNITMENRIVKKKFQRNYPFHKAIQVYNRMPTNFVKRSRETRDCKG